MRKLVRTDLQRLKQRREFHADPKWLWKDEDHISGGGRRKRSRPRKKEYSSPAKGRRRMNITPS
jgi:hypothetical protein